MQTTPTTVVMRLAGPMMAWGAGTGADWETRPSLRRPTKCGVIGLVANMMGRDRTDDITDLAALQFSVRADRPGHLFTDHQTAGGGAFPPLPADVIRDPELAKKPERWAYGAPRAPREHPNGVLVAGWTPTARATVMTYKSYLADAAFLCGLTGDTALIATVVDALRRPQRLPSLGRRNCPLSHPPLHLITPQPDWYRVVPLLAEATTRTPEVWYETIPGDRTVLSPEQPVTFGTRGYRSIAIATLRVTPPEPQTSHENREHFHV